VIVETTSMGVALVISKAMPFVITGLLVGWMAQYGQRAKRRGERVAQAARDASAPGRADRDAGISGPDGITTNRSATPTPPGLT
jgi:hypothetical protein